jgi:hypothetical protein
VAVVSLLLEKGIDVNAKMDNGSKPLELARRNGHEAIVTLLENGARGSVIRFKVSNKCSERRKLIANKPASIEASPRWQHALCLRTSMHAIYTNQHWHKTMGIFQTQITGSKQVIEMEPLIPDTLNAEVYVNVVRHDF